MKWLRFVFGLVLMIFSLVPYNTTSQVHADSPALIFSEIKVRNDTSGFDEFVELYNPNTEAVSLNDYFIGYVNLPAPVVDQTFATSVIGDGLLAGGESFVLAKNETDPNLPSSKKSPFASLSDSGGTLRITDAQNVVVDQFSWTSTASLAIDPIQLQCTASTVNCNANKSQSFGRGKAPDGQYLLISPTWKLGEPTPQSVGLIPISSPEPDPVSDPAPDPTPDPATTDPDAVVPPPEDTTADVPDVPSTTLLPPQITELLPNPAPPASDITDEYIELYNPNDQAIDLTGYRLQSGNTFSYNYTFAGGSLDPHEYKAFMITETGDILSNTSGQARLLDSTSTVVSQTNVYDTANDGDAWAFINGVWQWTTTPTPNAANVLTLPVLKVSASKTIATKKAAAKKNTPKASTTKKVAAAKTTKPAKAAAERSVYQDPAETITPIHPSILAGVGLITIVYAAYEYRYDVINRLQQFRRNREIRRVARSAPKG